MSVMIGIDPHKGSHAAAALDAREVAPRNDRCHARFGDLSDCASGEHGQRQAEAESRPTRPPTGQPWRDRPATTPPSVGSSMPSAMFHMTESGALICSLEEYAR